MRTSPENFKKNLLACLLGPLASIPAVILLDVIGSIFGYEFTNMGLPLAILILLFFSYVITLSFGLPITLYLQRLNKFNLTYLMGVTIASVVLFSFAIGFEIGAFLGVLWLSLSVALACWFLYKSG